MGTDTGIMSGLCRLALFLALAAAATAIPTLNLPTEEPPHVAAALEDTLHAEFVAWKSKFAKMYEGVEHSERFAVFKANLKKIAEHNKLYEAGEETFHMAVNQFADMTSEEFAAWSKKANGYRADLRDTNLKSVPTRPLAQSARTAASALSRPPLTGAPRAPLPMSRTRASVAAAGPSPPQAPSRALGRCRASLSFRFPRRNSCSATRARTRDATAASWKTPTSGSSRTAVSRPRRPTRTTRALAPLVSVRRSSSKTRKFTSQITATSPRTTRRTWRRRSRSSLLLLRLRPTRPRSSFTRGASSRLRSVASSWIMASSRWATVWTPRPR